MSKTRANEQVSVYEFSTDNFIYQLLSIFFGSTLYGIIYFFLHFKCFAQSCVCYVLFEMQKILCNLCTSIQQIWTNVKRPVAMSRRVKHTHKQHTTCAKKCTRIHEDTFTNTYTFEAQRKGSLSSVHKPREIFLLYLSRYAIFAERFCHKNDAEAPSWFMHMCPYVCCANRPNILKAKHVTLMCRLKNPQRKCFVRLSTTSSSLSQALWV